MELVAHGVGPLAAVARKRGAQPAAKHAQRRALRGDGGPLVLGRGDLLEQPQRERARRARREAARDASLVEVLVVSWGGDATARAPTRGEETEARDQTVSQQREREPPPMREAQNSKHHEVMDAPQKRARALTSPRQHVQRDQLAERHAVAAGHSGRVGDASARVLHGALAGCRGPPTPSDLSTKKSNVLQRHSCMW